MADGPSSSAPSSFSSSSLSLHSISSSSSSSSSSLTKTRKSRKSSGKGKKRQKHSAQHTQDAQDAQRQLSEVPDSTTTVSEECTGGDPHHQERREHVSVCLSSDGDDDDHSKAYNKDDDSDEDQRNDSPDDGRECSSSSAVDGIAEKTDKQQPGGDLNDSAKREATEDRNSEQSVALTRNRETETETDQRQEPVGKSDAEQGHYREEAADTDESLSSSASSQTSAATNAEQSNAPVVGSRGFDVLRTLGQTDYTMVCLVRDIASRRKVVLKSVDSSLDNLHGSKKERKAQRLQIELETLCLEREHVTLKQLGGHPHINATLGKFVERGTSRRHLILEYCVGGDLRRRLNDQGGPFREKRARQLWKQIISAIRFAHRHHICHRDLKLENLFFLDKKCKTLVVGDWGLSTEFEKDTLLDEDVGTLQYAAPELFGDDGYLGPQVDMWSLGVILYTLNSGSLPFCQENDLETFKRIQTATYKMPRYFSDELKDLVSSLLQPDPVQRITIRDVRRHPWTRGRPERKSSRSTVPGSQQRTPLDISQGSVRKHSTKRRERGHYKKSESSGSLPQIEHRGGGATSGTTAAGPATSSASVASSTVNRSTRTRTASVISRLPNDDTASCISDTEDTMTATLTAQQSDDEEFRDITDGDNTSDWTLEASGADRTLTRVRSEYVGGSSLSDKPGGSMNRRMEYENNDK